ncbi:lactate dehydrogenase [Ligilactobacillus salivarius]|nr:lactate dehydrogenase [Ligilactobacillus salivarius]
MMLLSIDVDRDNFAQKNSWIQKVVTEAVANGFNGIVVLDSNKDYLLINEILKYTGLSSRQVLGLGTSIESEVVARMVAKKLGINSNYIQTSVIGTRDKSFVLWSKGRVAEASLMSLIVQEKNMFSIKNMQEISKEYKGLAEKTRKLIFSSVLNKILMAMDTSEQFIITLVHSRNEEIESYSSPVLVGKMGVIELIKVNYTEDEQDALNEVKKVINDELDRYKLR